MRLGIAAMALGAALAACGTPVTGTPSAAPGARDGATPSAAGAPPAGAPRAGTPSADAPSAGAPRAVDAAAVESAFRAYNQALLTRDWPTACGLAAPATIAKMLENVRTKGGVAVTTCEEAYAALYADGAKAAAADGLARSAQIERIDVNGDAATVTWSGTYNGQRPIAANQLVRAEGKWLLLDTGG